MLSIKTPSRIHITLIDLNAKIGRVDGGVGFALKNPFIELIAKEDKEIVVIGKLKDIAKIYAKKVINFLNVNNGIYIKIINSYEPHIGLGSETQLALAIGKAISEIYKKELSIEEIAKIVNRGGTSGIGFYAFQKGGFILDCGHRLKEKNDFLPSSFSKANPPKLILRKNFPNWKVVLTNAKVKNKFFGKKELSIFKKYCPIPIKEVQKLSHLILMKLLPSLIEKDIENFGSAINEIQNIGFKKIENNIQRKETKELMRFCRKYSYGVGLSSFGPTLYCIVDNEKELIEKLKEKNADYILSMTNNIGSKIKVFQNSDFYKPNNMKLNM